MTHIELAPASPVPLYSQLADGLKAAIASGDVSDGEPLESSRALAQRLHISRDTVVHAHRVLVRDGFAEQMNSRRLTACSRALDTRTTPSTETRIDTA